MTPFEASKTLTEEWIAEQRRHPRFRATCDASARGGLDHFHSLAPFHQWVTKDIGRGSIVFGAIIQQLNGRLTAHHLVSACVAQGVSSPGRVNQLLRRVQEAGELTVAEGEGVWTRRPMKFADSFVNEARERLAVDLKAMVSLTPELAQMESILEDEQGYLSYVVALATILGVRRDLFALSRQPPLNAFLNREAGIHILWELMLAQPPERERLLADAPISRNALSHRYDVSRAHINKLLADSGHARADGDRVYFTEALSDRMERHMALVFRLNEVVGKCLLGGWRARPVAEPQAAAG